MEAMGRTSGLAATLPVVCALVLAGCGGDDLSTEDYAHDLEEICADLKAETERIQRSRPADTTELTRQVAALRDATTTGIGRMKSLERPEGDDGEKAQRYVSELEEASKEDLLPALEDLEDAIAAGDRPGIRAAARRLQEIDDQSALARTDRLARDLGANRCAGT
jgi:hypothetical protein